MNHEKTFEAINKLRDIELELHRLKNALELANKALDAQRQWVGLTDEDDIVGMARDAFAVRYCALPVSESRIKAFAESIEAKLKEKNHGL